MSLRNVLCLSAVILLLGAASTAQADVPELMNYQGILLDSGGDPVTTPVNVVFAIWNAEVDGDSVWSEARSVTPDADGAFSILLGETMPLVDTVFSDPERYLGIAVAGDPEMTPRVRLSSVPWAHHAATVEGFSPGPNNVAEGLYSFVAGNNNAVLADYGSICGGFGNIVEILDSVIDTTFDTTGFGDLYENSYLLSPTSVESRLPQCDICDPLTDLFGNLPGGEVVGGWDNHASAPGCFIGAGSANETFRAFSTVTGGGSNKADGYYSTIGGGYCNHTLWSTYYPGQPNNERHTAQTIGGGWRNCSDASLSTIGGGAWNTIETNSPRSTIGGGSFNTIHDWDKCSAIGGGHGNDIRRPCGTIAGGWQNDVNGSYSTIGGGGYNMIQELAVLATISGGGWTDGSNKIATSNRVWDDHGTVGGGGNNKAGSYDGDHTNSPFATVGGGEANQASGNHSTISGGVDNTASSNHSTIGGGQDNNASNIFTTVGGGQSNNAGGSNATIGGGQSNSANASYTTVGGGRDNLAYGEGAAIGGGQLNTASKSNATIGGGNYNTASGLYSTVPGGRNNTADGDYSFAAGRRAKANNQGCFVWGDATNSDITAAVDNQWRARCSGGVYYFTNSAMTSGVFVASGGGSWSSISDRNLKDNFTPVNARDVLDKIAALPMSTWNYKAQDESIRHMGPMAQDLYTAFGLGIDDKHINTIDADGIALAAIQGLYQQNQEQQQRIEQLEALVKQMLENKQ